jgi:hypothetical protein
MSQNGTPWARPCLKVKRVLFNFCNLRVGNVALLAAVLAGMESSKASWCLLCAMGAKEFNCDWEDGVSKEKTRRNACDCLLQCPHKPGKSESVKNDDGVNAAQLILTDA